MNKYLALKQDDKYLLERRKEGFDPSKFTIVGEPTITEGGIASGFGVWSNYIKPSKNIPIGGLSWEVRARVYTANNTKDDGYQTIFVDTITTSVPQLNIAINRLGTGLVIAVRNEENNDWLISVGANQNQFSIDSWHDIYVVYKNKTIFGYADEILLYELPIDLDNRIFNNTQLIGVSLGGSAQVQYGLIDLPSISITVDGKEIFTGAKEYFYMLQKPN